MTDPTPLPSYSSSQPTYTSPAERPVPPTVVNAAFWLYVASAVVSVITVILSAVLVDVTRAAVKAQVAQQGRHISAAQVDTLVNVAIVTSVVVGLLFAAVFVLFAVFMRRGANWARIVLLVLTVLSVTSALGSFGLGALRLVLAIIATILVFLPSASGYFRAARQSRQLQ
jgi:hypothetical protein